MFLKTRAISHSRVRTELQFRGRVRLGIIQGRRIAEGKREWGSNTREETSNLPWSPPSSLTIHVLHNQSARCRDRKLNAPHLFYHSPLHSSLRRCLSSNNHHIPHHPYRILHTDKKCCALLISSRPPVLSCPCGPPFAERQRDKRTVQFCTVIRMSSTSTACLLLLNLVQFLLRLHLAVDSSRQVRIVSPKFPPFRPSSKLFTPIEGLGSKGSPHILSA